MQLNTTTKFEVPKVFSFIIEPSETVAFFNRLTEFITDRKNDGKDIYVDLLETETITPDALMYLLAVIYNIDRHYSVRHNISGSLPRNSAARKLVQASGFYSYVKHTASVEIAKDTDNIQIVSGDKVMTELAKRISDFVCRKGNFEKRHCQFLYNIMIELMANVHNHAYNEKNCIMYPRWYCFADYNVINNTVSFTFMDTGEGIPSTVRKNFFEQLGACSDGKYVISALNGDYRSETRLPYRGKGLPKILEACQRGKLLNMRIISNHADVSIGSCATSKDMPVSLLGTLFYWQINLSKIGEVM